MGASLGGERNVRLLSPEIASPTYLQRDRPEREPQTTEDLCAVCLSELSRAKSELLSELGNRLRTVETELSVEETVAAIQRCAKQGDDSKIPMIATLLQAAPSGSEGPAAVQELEVRLAAVQALRTLVPAFPAQWPGWQAVRGLLREVACEAGAAEELRLSAVQALKEVSRRDARDEALPGPWVPECHVQHFIARRPFLLLRLVDPSISEAEAIMVRALMFSFVALASAAVRQGTMSMWSETHDTLVAYKSEGSACKYADRLMGGLNSEQGLGRPGSDVVQIVDSGSWATFDCHMTAFNQITHYDTGFFPITYEEVACDTSPTGPVAGVLQYDYYFTKIVFSNLRYPVQSAELTIGGKKHQMKLIGGWWSAWTGPIQGKTSFRITEENGYVVNFPNCFDGEWKNRKTGDACYANRGHRSAKLLANDTLSEGLEKTLDLAKAESNVTHQLQLANNTVLFP
eukprot:s1273_g9.t1